MIDFAKVIASATASAKSAAERKAEPVTDQAVADEIDRLARHGYIPDHQTPAIVRAHLEGYGLLLSGTVGTGKTMLATLLYGRGRIQHAQRDIADWGLADLNDWFLWRDGRDIVIDDLGFERPTAHFGEHEDLLRLVIERRSVQADKCRTSVTTNLSSEQISKRYGDRILDRLLGMCKPFRLEGPSMRRAMPCVGKAGV